jgi:hypothetical protein
MLFGTVLKELQATRGIQPPHGIGRESRFFGREQLVFLKQTDYLDHIGQSSSAYFQTLFYNAIPAFQFK